MQCLFGGAPLATVAKLVFLCLVVGAIMTGLGFSPMTIVNRLLATFRSLAHLGFGAFRELGRYILTGAVVVIPLWLLARMTKGGR